MQWKGRIAYFNEFLAASLSLNPSPGTVSTLSSVSVLAFLFELPPPFSSIHFSNTPIAALIFFNLSSALVTTNEQHTIVRWTFRNRKQLINHLRVNTLFARDNNPRTVNFWYCKSCSVNSCKVSSAFALSLKPNFDSPFLSSAIFLVEIISNSSMLHSRPNRINWMKPSKYFNEFRQRTEKRRGLFVITHTPPSNASSAQWNVWEPVSHRKKYKNDVILFWFRFVFSFRTVFGSTADAQKSLFFWFFACSDSHCFVVFARVG